MGFRVEYRTVGSALLDYKLASCFVRFAKSKCQTKGSVIFLNSGIASKILPKNGRISLVRD